ncbi:MAG: RagB/SusD family nutrient uptake outer membrane protein [Flavobacteriaceae bacterium]|nr:RagB/SusD family nutrient uptake outer membrane protein [Flavobacteriaceae bacterium]
MKKTIQHIVFCSFVLLGLLGCDKYLDIVPDKTQEVSLMFQRKEAAYPALVTCYSYLPQNDGLYATFTLASDELTTPLAKEPNSIKLMKGQQVADNPIMSFWSGYGASGRGQGSLWDGIRACNTLIANIDQAVDMTQVEKNTWKAEATVLKAYYHFLLLNYYGPIPTVDVNLPIDASDEELRVHRNTVDEVVTYILNTLDLSISDLPERVTGSNDLGRMDQVIAHAIKSKVSLYAASPFFNGNSEFYSDFLNHEGVHFFNQNNEISKWETAAISAEDAIAAALAQGAELYKYTGSVPRHDQSNFQYITIRTLYDIKYSIVDKWNSEVLWGDSNPVNDWWRLQSGALMKDPTASSVQAAWQWVAPTMRMAELYYTENGLPIEEDLMHDFSDKFSTVRVSSSQKMYALPGLKTAKLHLHREPRFYSSIGFDAGQYRAWGELWNLRMKKGQTHGRIANSSDYLITGFSLKKLIHPDSEGDAYDKLIRYPWPNARLAELYLNYAEALNEAYGPSQAVYDALNVVRSRAGIPDVEVVWSNASLAKNVNKHTTQSGLREIIRQERMIELAFEGHRYNDIRRWKLADQYFNSNVRGWSVDENSDANFYKVIDVGIRSFETPRDYLHPIQTSELVTNPNLIQNPQW